MKKILAIMAAMGMMLCSCSSDEPSDAANGANQDERFVPVSLSAAEKAAAEASASFQYRLFSKACELADPNENVIVSPLSARILLSMLANATSPEGRDEITHALGCDDINALNSLGSALLSQLPAMDGMVSMSLAQSVWYDRQYTLAPDFAELVAGFYNADFFPRDTWNRDAMLAEINRWCSDRTGGRIPQYLDRYDPVMVLLANAMHFQAKWKNTNRFDESKTTEMTFHGASADSKVRMMRDSYSGLVLYGENFSGIMRRFGNSDGARGFMIYCILPDEGTSVNELAADNSIMDHYKTTGMEINLALPKFSLTSGKKTLDETLKALGVNKIFYPEHQRIFSVGPSEFLWKTNQGASISINEEGAEIAAVTFGHGGVSAYFPSPMLTIDITFDRPFLFFVTENGTGSVLLAGKVMNL